MFHHPEEYILHHEKSRIIVTRVKIPTFLINFYSKLSIQSIKIIKLPRINWKKLFFRGVGAWYGYNLTSVYDGFTKDSIKEKNIIIAPQRKKYWISSYGLMHPSTVGGADIYDSYVYIYINNLHLIGMFSCLNWVKVLSCLNWVKVRYILPMEPVLIKISFLVLRVVMCLYKIKLFSLQIITKLFLYLSRNHLNLLRIILSLILFFSLNLHNIEPYYE